MKIKFLLFVILFINYVLLIADEKTDQAVLTISHLKSLRAELNEQINDIIKQASGVNLTLGNICTITSQINEIKTKNNITATEQNLNTQLTALDTTATPNIFAAAIDPKDKTNYYNKIYSILQNNIIQNAIVQQNLNLITQLKADIADRIKSYVAQIQNYGTIIYKLTQSTEQAQAAQTIASIYSSQNQLIQQRLQLKEDDKNKLFDLEAKLTEQLLLLQQNIALLPAASQANIKLYQDQIKAFEVILNYMRFPGNLARITADQIVGLDTQKNTATKILCPYYCQGQGSYCTTLGSFDVQDIPSGTSCNPNLCKISQQGDGCDINGCTCGGKPACSNGQACVAGVCTISSNLNITGATNFVENLVGKESEFYDDINTIIQQAPSAPSIMNKICDLLEQIGTIKTTVGITSTEQNINGLIDSLTTSIAPSTFAKAFYNPTDTSVNYFYNIFDITKFYIVQDDIIQQNLNRINKLQLDTSDKIKNQVLQIQQYGNFIQQLTAKKEQVQVQQNLGNIYQSEGSVLTAKYGLTDETTKNKLFDLENQLIDQQNSLQAKIATLPSDKQIKLRSYSNQIKQIDLLINYLRQPNILTRLTPAELIGLEPQTEMIQTVKQCPDFCPESQFCTH